MKTVLKWMGIVVGSLLLLAVVVVGGFYFTYIRKPAGAVVCEKMTKITKDEMKAMLGGLLSEEDMEEAFSAAEMGKCAKELDDSIAVADAAFAKCVVKEETKTMKDIEKCAEEGEAVKKQVGSWLGR